MWFGGSSCGLEKTILQYLIAEMNILWDKLLVCNNNESVVKYTITQLVQDDGEEGEERSWSLDFWKFCLALMGISTLDPWISFC